METPTPTTAVNQKPKEKHQGKKAAAFIRDYAQEQTLMRWRRTKEKVTVQIIGGQTFEGTLVEVGIYTIHLLLSTEDELDIDPPVLESVCIFKTAIAAIHGSPLPKTVDTPKETEAVVAA